MNMHAPVIWSANNYMVHKNYSTEKLKVLPSLCSLLQRSLFSILWLVLSVKEKLKTCTDLLTNPQPAETKE